MGVKLTILQYTTEEYILSCLKIYAHNKAKSDSRAE
jgi:hypothetical protein